MPLSNIAQLWADKMYSKEAKQIDIQYQEKLTEFARGLVKREDVEARQGTHGYIDERILSNKSKAHRKAETLREAYKRDEIPFSEGVIEEIVISVGSLLEGLNAQIMIDEAKCLDEFKARTSLDEGHDERLSEIRDRVIRSWSEIVTEIRESLQLDLADQKLKEKSSSAAVISTAESVSRAYLQEFKDLIRPFSDVFDQLSVACIAVRPKDKWVSLFTRLELNNSVDVGSTQEQVVEIGPNFCALFFRYSPETLGTMLKELTIQNSLSLTSGDKNLQVFANRVAAGLTSQTVARPEPGFYGIVKPLREYAEDKMQYRPSIEIHSLGDRVSELISSDDIERISRQLRAHKYPHAGLGALLKAMGSRINFPTSDQGAVEIAAVLPFNARYADGALRVECPESIAPRMSARYFFSNSCAASEPYLTHEPIVGRTGYCSVSFKVPWPADALQADAYIRYAEEEVEKLTIRNWAGAPNWKIAVDHFFDPDLKFLRRALKTANESEVFEHAIVRLLTLGGLKAIWHGTSRQKGRSDLAAYYEGVTRRVVILGECTLDKPEAKFSPLKSRANQLRQMVNQAEILAVVFTPCSPAQADYEQAANAGIALCGGSELAQLLEHVENDVGPGVIIGEIEEMISEPRLLPEIPRSAYMS
jgi:hypothetical protein